MIYIGEYTIAETCIVLTHFATQKLFRFCTINRDVCGFQSVFSGSWLALQTTVTFGLSGEHNSSSGSGSSCTQTWRQTLPSWQQLVWGGVHSGELPPRTSGHVVWAALLQTDSGLPPPPPSPLPLLSPSRPSVAEHLWELPAPTRTWAQNVPASLRAPVGPSQLFLPPRGRAALLGGPELRCGRKLKEAKLFPGLWGELQQPRGGWRWPCPQTAVLWGSGGPAGPNRTPVYLRGPAPGQQSARAPWCACVGSLDRCSASGSPPSCSSRACLCSECGCVWIGRWSSSNVCCSLRKGRCRVSLLRAKQRKTLLF